MASMREMAKKNLEKMVKGAAREVNTSRPAPRDGRSGASATPAAPKKTTGETPAKSAAAPEAAAPAKAAASSDKVGTISEAGPVPTTTKADAAVETAASSGKVDAASDAEMSSAKVGASEATPSAKAGTAPETGASSEESAGAAKNSVSSEASAEDTMAISSRVAATASSAKAGAAPKTPASSVKAPVAAGPSGASAADTEITPGRAAATAKAAPSPAKTTSAAAVASSSAKAPGVPAAVFEQLQTQIQKNGKTIQKVPVDSIKLNENIREAYNDEHLKTLADSMQKDGLIQFPTLCLKTGANGEFTFVCKNGHRRILAAKSLGWKTIECVILPFASTRDELYHTIAANLREDVYYLDLAQAYQQANHLGESDQAIAERVGVNPRTVGWYRRLTTMAPDCQTLCRQYPELFHATWAIQLARKGELPPLAVLMKQMQFMLVRYQALKNNADQAAQPDRLPKTIDVEQQKEARASLKSLFSGARGSTEAQQAWQLIEQLCIAGYFKPALLNRMRRQLLSGAQKSSRRASAAEA